MTKQVPDSRIKGLDALRGIAALSVVMYHIVGPNPKPGTGGALSFLLMPFLRLATFGYASVFLFFVISGFCIHLRWAKQKAAGREPQIQFGAFWRRRVWRLYPPYIIALFLYLSIAALTSNVAFSRFYLWDLISHVFMIHNLDTKTVYSINGVFWTLAIEEQLYLAYFVLLFFRKRLGWIATLTICFAARIGWLYLVQWLRDSHGIETPLTEAALVHWFTWALGALGVEAALGIVRLPAWTTKFRTAVIALACAIAIALSLDKFSTGAWHDPLWLLMHPAWGLGFFALVNYMVVSEADWRDRSGFPIWLRVFGAIGLFSYSLYLIHELVLMETWHFYFLGLSDTVTAFLISTPLSIIAAWVFYLFCERPFIVKKSNETGSTPSAGLSDTVPVLRVTTDT